MKYQVNNDSLMHYGVLGMKWGVRNAETRAKYANSGSGKGSKKPSYRSTSIRSARRAPEVGAKRSAAKASLKRTATMTVKAAVTSAVIAGGVYALQKHGAKITADQAYRAKAGADWLKKAGLYVYF